jgi:hypothetical protein
VFANLSTSHVFAATALGAAGIDQVRVRITREFLTNGYTATLLPGQLIYTATR